MEKIASIKPEHKIKITSDNNIYIEEISTFNSIKRFIKSDNRETSVLFISNIIEKLCNIFNNIVDDWEFDKKINTEYIRDLKFLKDYSTISTIYIHFKDAIQGIENLKTTYIKDENICFKLDLIFFKLKKYCRIFEDKFHNIVDVIDEE